MAIHSRHTRILALVGALALGGASAVWAQDTSAAARTDTSGYQGYQKNDSTRTDTSGFKYTGPSTDTTLKAKPGAQTGPSAGDTGKAAQKMGGAGAADTVVCKDGSNAPGGQNACSAHGGIDSAATKAAKKARGWTGKADTSSTTPDTSSTKPQSP